MTRKEIIDKLKPYFDIRELVCNHVYERFKDRAWMFLSTELLHTLLVLRTEIINLPMIVNTSTMKQRGLRCNMCPLVQSKKYAYLSPHVLGKGIDFTCTGKTAEEIRLLIRDNADKLPYKIRLEKNVSWVHIDCYDQGFNNKITEFAA